MITAVTPLQMREMDRRTIEDYMVPGLVLMEQAALRVVEEIERHEHCLSGKTVVILAGKGNNGGDGLAAARILSTRSNVNISVWCFAQVEDFGPDCKTQYDIAKAYGVDLVDVSRVLPPHALAMLAGADLVVDAVYGTGFIGTLNGTFVQLIPLLRETNCRVCSVDVPSGVNASTGEIGGDAVSATYTVTFACPKIGMLQYPAATNVGELIVVSIGMPHEVMCSKGAAIVPEAADIGRLVPRRAAGRDSNKGRFGHVGVIAGSRGMIGAACMCSYAAVKTGAGLVTLLAADTIVDALMANMSWSVMVRGLASTSEGTVAYAALDAALGMANKWGACAIGPGLSGQNTPDTSHFVLEFIARCPVPLLIDADALTILSAEPDQGASVVKQRSGVTVLTPHPGEMGRLLGIPTAEVQEDRISAVTNAATKFQCTVLLKGTRTLVADECGNMAINTTSNPGMATGGSGDVLSGIITTLLGQEIAPFDSAYSGAYIHGLAGDIAAANNGSTTGLAAPEIIDQIPSAIGQCQQKAEI